MIAQYHRAGFPVIWLETSEPERATSEIASDLKGEGVEFFTWDLLRGVRDVEGNTPRNTTTDPVETLTWLADKAPQPCALVCSLLHRLITSPEIEQAILSGAQEWKATGRQLVILVPPGVRPPTEIARVTHTIEQPLPTADRLRSVAEAVAHGNEGIEVADPVAVGEALRGLTVAEAENAVALAAVRDEGTVHARAVWQETATAIKAASGGALELRQGEGGFDTLGGLERLKAFAAPSARSPKSRGVILLGVPGGGKTAFALALGAEVGLPVYLWDLGRLFGSLVGESEAAARRAIRAIQAAGRCVLLIDEIEKGAAGMGSSGQTDSGVTARTMGAVLTWLSDRPAGGAYVIGTCNDVSKLPPELTRAERWDATFFVDLPTPAEREAIYEIHARNYGIKDPFDARLTDGWTGAEIRSLCRLADLLGTSTKEAAGYVVPLSRSRGAEIERLRSWANGRCVPASVKPTTSGGKVRRIRNSNPNAN